MIRPSNDLEAAGPGFYLGAYAASATLQPWNEEEERLFWQDIVQLPSISGLELPFHAEGQPGVETLISQLPSSWNFILTLLPGVMQSLGRDPCFGLASNDEQGRRAALALAEKARLWVGAVQRYSARSSVKAVHLHSAPRRGRVASSASSLSASLKELLAKDWFGARLCLEHCDAWRAGHEPAKGFLELGEELTLARDLGLGITLNWGRSAIETRSQRGVFEHIEAALRSGQLWGFMFSGTAVQDPLYGNWQDNHAPIRLDEQEPWNPRGGLLSSELVEDVFQRLKNEPLRAWGLKVQPFPASLTRSQRLACLKAQLLALEKAQLK